jgi:hypothetical protein
MLGTQLTPVVIVFIGIASCSSEDTADSRASRDDSGGVSSEGGAGGNGGSDREGAGAAGTVAGAGGTGGGAGASAGSSGGAGGQVGEDGPVDGGGHDVVFDGSDGGASRDAVQADSSTFHDANDAKADTSASDPETLCLKTGGTVVLKVCCEAAADFPDTCLVGSCGCAPANSHSVNACSCAAGCYKPGLGCGLWP